MKYQISFSGGLGSAVTALVAHETHLDFNLIFADTLVEDPDLYRFNADVAAAVGKEIVHLRDGRTPWDVYVDKKWIGNTRTAHCSTELKTIPVMKWLETNSNPDDPLVLGMDLTEEDRVERAIVRWAPRPVISLLIDMKVDRSQFDDILKRYNLTPPRLYGMGFLHNNCGGFCCKAGLKQFQLLNEKLPEVYGYHAKEMDRAMRSIGPTARPFLRKTINKQIQYITLTEYREALTQKSIVVPEFDESGCGCFTDEG